MATVSSLSLLVEDLTAAIHDLGVEVDTLKAEVDGLKKARSSRPSAPKQCPVCYKYGCTTDHTVGQCSVCHAPQGKPHARVKVDGVLTTCPNA